MLKIDHTYLPRLWRCEECRSILGVVMRDTDRVRRLWVLKKQLPADQSLPNDDLLFRFAVAPRHRPRGLWRIYGMDSGLVGCDACGSIEKFQTSTEALCDMIRTTLGEEGVKKFKELCRAEG